MFYQTSAL